VLPPLSPLSGTFSDSNAEKWRPKRTNQAAVHPAPSLAAFGALLETDLLLGLHRSVYLAGIGLDVAHLDVQAAAKLGDPERSACLIRRPKPDMYPQTMTAGLLSDFGG